MGLNLSRFSTCLLALGIEGDMANSILKFFEWAKLTLAVVGISPGPLRCAKRCAGAAQVGSSTASSYTGRAHWHPWRSMQIAWKELETV